eukprot:scaffold88563_cov18-Tisochrysis_lutea.AAC.1
MFSGSRHTRKPVSSESATQSTLQHRREPSRQPVVRKQRSHLSLLPRARCNAKGCQAKSKQCVNRALPLPVHWFSHTSPWEPQRERTSPEACCKTRFSCHSSDQKPTSRRAVHLVHLWHCIFRCHEWARKQCIQCAFRARKQCNAFSAATSGRANSAFSARSGCANSALHLPLPRVGAQIAVPYVAPPNFST